MSAALEAFAEHLATRNANERQSDLAKVNLLASQQASPESLDEATRVGLLRRRVDLGQLLRDGIPPVEYASGEFARRMVYAAGVTGFSGHPDSGKTSLVCRLALDAMKHGQHVVYLDFENGEDDAARRFLDMGADADLLTERLVYVPFPGALDFGEIGAVWDEFPGAMGVFDSTRGMLRTAGLTENDASDTAKVFDPLVEFALTQKVPCLVIDHVTKATTSSTGYARGSGDKLAAVQGQWYVEKVSAFDETTTGEISLTKWKARKGRLHSFQRFAVGDGQGNLTFRKLDVDLTPEGRVDTAVIALLKDQVQPVSLTFIESEVDGTAQTIRERVKAMAADSTRPVKTDDALHFTRYAYDSDADNEPQKALEF